MSEHLPESLIGTEVQSWCRVCGKQTRHRVDRVAVGSHAGKAGPCLEHGAKEKPKTKAVTIPAKTGLGDWLVIYIEAKRGKPAERREKFFIEPKDAIAFVNSRPANTATIWRRAGANFQQEMVGPE
jgi:hypothetical protein